MHRLECGRVVYLISLRNDRQTFRFLLCSVGDTLAVRSPFQMKRPRHSQVCLCLYYLYYVCLLFICELMNSQWMVLCGGFVVLYAFGHYICKESDNSKTCYITISYCANECVVL